MVTDDTIEFDVRCLGCENLIARPSEADPILFRRGLNVHKNQDCIHKATVKLEQRKVRV
jgi:hypothetical protein